jgi:DNA polymerase (family 10)
MERTRTISNADIARMLYAYADLLEIEGANAYRVRAYRNASSTIAVMPRDVAEMVHQGEDLTEIWGIGEALAEKLQEIVTTGRLQVLDELEHKLGPGIATLLKVRGLGPKRVNILYQQLGITSLDKLEEAAQMGRIRELRGFGEQTERTILEDIERVRRESQRVLWAVADQAVGPLIAYLREDPNVEIVSAAGSYRRGQETVGDLDVVAASDVGGQVIRRYLQYGEVEEVLSEGETRSSVRLRSGLQVDLRVVPRESYGAALQYLTGSKEHGVALRGRAQRQGLKVNEYGVFRGEERIAGETEEGVYEALGLVMIPPELRENRGEIDAADRERHGREGALPHLLTLDAMRGDLQAHTDASDGASTLEEMARAAQERGYAYLAITDHSRHIGVTNGLDPERLARQVEAIDRLNEVLEGIMLLKGSEVDIREDGTLALPDDTLELLDVVIIAVHSHFDLSREAQTERILRAMDNPRAHILGHPTGRVIGERPPYDVDVPRLIEAARERGVILEINAQPQRLDLDDVYAKAAKDAGVLMAVSTDAHHATQLGAMRFGVMQARRGWLEARDVVNTRPLEELRALLRR